MSFILKEKKIHLHYCYYYFLAIYLKKRKKERKKERKPLVFHYFWLCESIYLFDNK